jgi:hypothetical protein
MPDPDGRSAKDDLSKAELCQRAVELDIPGRSGMKRDEFQHAVERAA